MVFDDTVLDKTGSEAIEIARWQYSGNAGKVVQGIGVVTCIYYNPEVDRYWAIDYRIYSPDQEGKGKIDHVEDMIRSAIYSKNLLFQTVLMDTWYATNRLMLFIHHHIPLTNLEWSDEEQQTGIAIHLNKVRTNFHVQCFRITVSNHRTDYVVTNDLSQKDTHAVQKAYGLRWMIETLHRELKNITGIEKCQCRRQRNQRNHIACAFLVWTRLKQIGHQTKQTIYQLKQGLLRNYMIEQLRSPTIRMDFA